MYARHTTVYPHAERIADMAAAIRDSALPFYREQPGYAGFLIMTGAQEVVGVTLWAS